MKSTILKYGPYAFITALVLFGLPFLLGKNVSFKYGEVIGYTSMVISLLFIYFAIKHYRDSVNEGIVSFGKALVIGLLVSLFAALGVAIADYIYTTVINPNFSSDYLEYSLSKMETQLSAEEFKTKSAELTQQMKDYGGSGFLAFIMFVTVMIIGFIISLISGLILQRKN